jgi:UDP-2-acetamido-2-deoxy-ribo-hexuluronate aminotransferase
LREAVAERYRELLDGVVQTPWIDDGNCSVYAQYTIEVDDRERVANALRQEGIPTAVHYPIPAHLQPAFRDLDYAKGDFPHSERAAGRVISLPMHPYLKAEEQHRICDAVKRAVAG